MVNMEYLLTVSSRTLAVMSMLLATRARAATPDINHLKSLDGVPIDSIETYSAPKANEITLGVGAYPFSSYFTGLSLNAGFTYHPSRTFAWEILNVQYFFSFQKDLTTELADLYSVNPQTISDLNYVIGSNLEYVYMYGKFVLLQDFIRYFRGAVIGGMGVVKSSDKNALAFNVGLKFEVFSSETFCWKVEIRDSVAVSGLSNYLTFNFGSGFSF